MLLFQRAAIASDTKINNSSNKNSHGQLQDLQGPVQNEVLILNQNTSFSFLSQSLHGVVLVFFDCYLMLQSLWHSNNSPGGRGQFRGLLHTACVEQEGNLGPPGKAGGKL